MKYECELCIFKTENKSVWYNHKKSQKHIKLEKLDQEIKRINETNGTINDDCPNKNIDMLLQKNEIELLKEKLKSIENEKNIIANQLIETKNQLTNQLIETKKQYKNQLIETKKQYENQLVGTMDHIETLKFENSFQKQLINSAGGIIQKSMNTMSYLLLNYNSAPVLTQLPNYSIISKNTDSLVNDLIHYYKKNKLDKHIGDFIVLQYKKKDPELQSIWSSDVDRLNYFVRELINDAKPLKMQTKKNIKVAENNIKFQWVADKKGIKMTEYVIDPLLNYINNMNITYLNKKNKEINDEFDLQTNSKILEDMQIIASINCDIKNHTLSKNINKYIAPHFYLDKCV